MADIKKVILTRVRVLYGIFVLIGMLIVGKILWLQFGPEAGKLKREAARITFEQITIPAQRGDILARDGRLLATSVPTYHIRMDFAAEGLDDDTFRKGVDSLALQLSRFFGDRSAERYRAMLLAARADKGHNRYARLSPRRVNFLELKQIGAFPILRLGRNKGGFVPEEVPERLLTNGSLAQRTIGFTNQAGTQLGIEGAFDSYLAGEDGSALMQRISGNVKVPVGGDTGVEPVNGIDVVTTLDIDLQDVAETVLRRQLATGGANWGTAVLMESSTGEIRAMANLTRRSDGSIVEDYNYAVAMNLEPGSTFKLVSLITLLDEGDMELDHRIDIENGRAVIGRTVVVDSHRGGGALTLKRIFEESSNVGFAKAVNEVYAHDPGRFTSHLSKMGFDKPLELQIPGEPDPVMWRPGDRSWSGMTLTMMSYGYAIRITPLHTLAFYNAVANGGRMMRPLLVRELRQYGQTVRTFPTETLNPSICSRRTLENVRQCLEGVVDEGTARILRNPLYRVAAKTGTAQIAQDSHGYRDAAGGRHYLATIVGYFPADNPRYTMIVCMKTYWRPGSGGTYYGASLAGPVFRAVADRVYAREVSWQPGVEQNPRHASSRPSLKGGNVREIRRVADKLAVPLSSSGNVGRWAVVHADSSSVGLTGVDLTPGVTPRVTGMGLKEAVYLLEKSGLRVAFSGRGQVLAQSIPPGEPAPRGSVITIVLGNE
ncbi:penicillin-binding protein [Bacteroidia bacterium]|nr:penicillin-binding protein [Bacteroidia bacterium]